MFLDYKIVNNILYLYVDDKCEIGSFYTYGRTSLLEKVKQYIKDKKIKFDGTKIVLILSGLLLGTIYLNNNINHDNYDVYKNNKYVYNIVDTKVPDINKNTDEKIVNELDNIEVNKPLDNNINTQISNNDSSKKQDTKKETKQEVKQETTYTKPETNIINDEIIVTVNRTNGTILKLGLEEYLVGVVSAEMPASFNEEALKAQAVIARTYTKKLIDSGRKITDSVKTQVYKSNDELKNMWGINYDKYYNKVKNAVLQTRGKCVTYNGEFIDAVYHSTSNGYTEDAIFVWGNSIPYLKTVTSPWDTSANSFLRSTDISFLEISSKLGFDFNYDTTIEIISKDESGRVSKIIVGDKVFTGVELRNILGLRSADFDVTKNSSGITFTTRGYGHGVGMSQYGANGMANSGYTYEQILKYYYFNVEVTNML